MSLSVLFYCIWAFFCRCCSFDLSLSCSSPFLLSYGTVSRGGGDKGIQIHRSVMIY